MILIIAGFAALVLLVIKVLQSGVVSLDAPAAMTSRCAWCGKPEGGGRKLKTCTACKSVKYCDVECQRNHRKAHRKECKRIENELLAKNEVTTTSGAEEDDEDLFNSPPKQDCPLCFLPMHTNGLRMAYLPCCGKTTCHGCHFKNDTLRSMIINGRASPARVCAFCRENTVAPDEQQLKRLEKRMAANDFRAYEVMALNYAEGKHGLLKDKEKEIELLRRAAELGSARSCYHLSGEHMAGGYLEEDHQKMMHYSKLAAKRGDFDARYNLGAFEANQGNFELAVKHWMISAADGEDGSLEGIRSCCNQKKTTEDKFKEARRAHRRAKKEMSSFERDMAEKYVDGGRDWSVFSKDEIVEFFGLQEDFEGDLVHVSWAGEERRLL